MELFDYFLQLICEESDVTESEKPNVKASLMQAVRRRQYAILNNDNNKFVGFVTWEIEGQYCGICNLLILKKFRKSYNLKRVISFLRLEYPKVRFTWHNRKRDRIFRQREEICTG